MIIGRGREVTGGGREKEVVLHVCKFTGMHTRTHYRRWKYESNNSYASAFPDYTHTHTHSYDTFRYILLRTHTPTHQALNDHINVEYTASYAYHALFSYFDRDTVGLAGHAKFFAGQSVEERGHAEEFMRYQNIRGIHS